MWKHFYLFGFLVATVQCQTFEAQVNTKLSNVESSRVELNGIFTGLRTNLVTTQSAITTLNGALPYSIYNDILSESISMMDILATDQAGKPDSVCFVSYLAARGTIIPAAQQTYYQCAYVQNARIVQQIVVLNNNIASLTNAAVSARVKLANCNTARYQASAKLFEYCLSSSTSDFDSVVAALKKTVDDLSSKRTAVVTELTTCVTNSVISSQKLLSSIIEGTKTCLKSSTSAEAAQLSNILPTVSESSQTFISDQVKDATTASTSVTEAKTKFSENINAAKTAVDPAVEVKALNLVSAKAALDNNFVTTKTAFDKAVTDKSSVPAAATCVNNIRNALANTINRHMYQYLACVTAIRSGQLNVELAQIQNLYNEAVAKEGDTVTQCLAQTANIAPADGIKQCREDADADAANYIIYLQARAATLKEEAAMVTAAGTRCKETAFNNVKRQNEKDKQLFETCIMRTTKTEYKITI